ncbi:6-pyruvoyl trahydropterin synthase family protein [Micromonospora chalcea]|uniref:6-pyruvoyl trahydropterin synthase family protein n=1 Tax=Micromonospora chalcea TaxID=1874 RepID=UPI001656D354|nr:6-pyruvoyl tetrahydropterin synthase family protein [Micromonospora chalcea]MBC8991791.1 6-pyruvoyl tetrahydropterin synthase family protein [Micromonospora chalcea]MCT2279789.1 6-pyruvoyl tetrahydropterin synthase family protein [Micromonospora chalcea]
MSRPAPAGSACLGRGIYRIGKTFTFEGAHLLGGLSEGHKCGRLHGHGYTVEVTLASRRLTGPGFVVDFAELDLLKRHLDGEFDHQLLNEVVDVEPTSENLARVLFDWCMAHLALPDGVVVEAVRVRETATSWAEYRQDFQ